jgi:hypothetical protein
VIILSHRGYWTTPDEKNTEAAFRRSFELGFGTETDFRDLDGDIVISHDPPRAGAMRAADFLALLGDLSLPIAVNVKADGLAAGLAEMARRAALRNWFVFDMSVPDTLEQLRVGNPVFCRLSEYEADGPLTRRAAGIWLDAFENIWYTPDLVRALLSRGQRVCVVSAELHGREPATQWAMLRDLAGAPNLMICTDRPDEARAAFARD